ncbi:helix-loop-helix DNA-binding domain-containing protein [Colletotrichum tofieldiae]|uniref:Helix-loop-helix DNA-binding domain-containing protein n=1 Tax=Colletotrichum tofieldiae TaxID=708197 RepID=A0A161W6V5_9PEZI|nr:helix-loop-helix DNA-binding domain-containing protein [Colletotrichum tofieldiae]
MPRPTLPPTPASSTDIKGQDGSKDLNSLQLSFELPPPAIVQDASRISPKDTRTSPNTEFQPVLPSKAAPYPVQPSETVKSRRRSSAAQKAASNESFALPPPPTRSRKIIQMKPRATQEELEEAPAAAGAKSGAAGPGKAGAAAAGTATTAQGKKKQPSATSAAGRKIARKTAHSLIERRRRSKMNEEFAVLKGMIPACTGEMHKLAILQASIEYVRYLEDCVAKLKAQRDASEARSPTESGLQTPAGRGESWGPIPQFVPRYQEDPDDVEMTDSEAPSPTFPPAQQQQLPQTQHARSQQPSVSPALLPQDASSRHRHDSYSSVSTDHRHYSYSTSTTTSPAFGPQTYVGYGHGGGLGSALTSPALAPQRDLDQEATAALLMLNSDRRGTIGEASAGAGAGAVRSAGRGMSVRDLLST